MDKVVFEDLFFFKFAIFMNLHTYIHNISPVFPKGRRGGDGGCLEIHLSISSVDVVRSN